MIGICPILSFAAEPEVAARESAAARRLFEMSSVNSEAQLMLARMQRLPRMRSELMVTARYLMVSTEQTMSGSWTKTAKH